MTEKKTAKKIKSSLSKKEATRIEKTLLDYQFEDKVLSIETDDGAVELHIKPYLDLEAREAILNSVESMYFPDGRYSKVRGDMILEFVLFQQYTGLDFGNDLSKFDKFIHSDIYRRDYSFDDLYFTEEYWSIKEDVQGMVDYILRVSSLNAEQYAFYHNFNELFASIKTLVENADNSLGQMAESIKSDTGVGVAEMLAALKDINVKDEKKIVNAVLDFQETKAKRQAEAVKMPTL